MGSTVRVKIYRFTKDSMWQYEPDTIITEQTKRSWKWNMLHPWTECKMYFRRNTHILQNHMIIQFFKLINVCNYNKVINETRKYNETRLLAKLCITQNLYGCIVRKYKHRKSIWSRIRELLINPQVQLLYCNSYT